MTVQDLMWYLSRSTGIVAGVLAVAALAWGTLFSARETGQRLRPAWWLDLHNWLGGLALIFTIVHLAASVLNRDGGIAVASVFVPGIASTDRLALAWGVIATYLFVGAVMTSWPRRLFSRRTWRIVHLGSVVGVALAIVHGYQMGTDASARLFRAGMLVLVAIGTYSLGVRLFGAIARNRNARGS